MYRLRDIVDSSGVDDMPELVAYCDKEIERIENSTKSPEEKIKIKEERYNDLSRYIFEVLDEDDFVHLDGLVYRLRERFPHRTWDREQIKRIMSQMVKDNLVERMGREFQDPYTLKVINTKGYRLVRGARLR